MIGTCKGCGTENVEVNEQGMCANCAAANEGGAGAGDAGSDTAAV
jgi:hypothetical protein